MAYSQGPYSAFTTLPSPDRPILHTARKIDYPRGRYVVSSDAGGFEGMSVTAQRVVNLVCLGVKPGTHLTDQSMEQARKDVITALSVLTGPSSPAIELRSVVVDHSTAGTQRITVDFKDLTTGLNDSVQLT